MAEFKRQEEDVELSFEEDGDEVFAEDSGNADDNEFDLIVGALEEVLFEGEISEIQKAFCEQHCGIFEDSEENKLEYTALFSQYTELVEKSLESKLKEKIPMFTMSMFESLLKRRDEDEISGDIFDILLSFGDFNEFKQYMLSVKKGNYMTCVELERTLSLCNLCYNLLSSRFRGDFISSRNTSISSKRSPLI